MIKMQDVVANESLGMTRGKYGSKAIRLEAQAYKLTKQINEYKKQNEHLKNEVEILLKQFIIDYGLNKKEARLFDKTIDRVISIERERICK